MRIIAYACNEWDRAEVLSTANEAGIVKVFFVDYGTNGFITYKNCKMLVEEYAILPKQAIRAALHGIKPVRNCRLWSLSVTQSFISSIRNKTHLLEIVKHHEHVSNNDCLVQILTFWYQEDFYEFLLYDKNKSIVNETLVQNQLADAADRYQPSTCLNYPSFNMLEKLVVYPTYDERFRMFKTFGVDFNEFEEKNIPLNTNASNFESELDKLLKDQKFAAIRNAFKNFYGWCSGQKSKVQSQQSASLKWLIIWVLICSRITSSTNPAQNSTYCMSPLYF